MHDLASVCSLWRFSNVERHNGFFPRRLTMPIRNLLACAVIAVLSVAVPAVADTLGHKPSYIWGSLSSVPNEQAIIRTIWAPGLEDGYVPQGLTHLADTVFVAGYNSTDIKVDKEPCRIFSISTTDGKQTGYFDMPEDCGHAGGLVFIGDGMLVVSDTRTLYKIDLARALVSKSAQDALISVVKLGGALKGSFVDFDGTDLWIGSSEKDATKAKAHRLSLDIFDQFNGKHAIKEDVALSTIPIPTEANGMAFDAGGTLWLSSSNSKYGAVYRLNAKTGEVQSRFEMVVGIEDLGFDADGKLWAVSEAGSRRWSRWSKTYPVIFQIDVSALK
jgi:sugar lactone lactonase YvrE